MLALSSARKWTSEITRNHKLVLLWNPSHRYFVWNAHHQSRRVQAASRRGKIKERGAGTEFSGLIGLGSKLTQRGGKAKERGAGTGFSGVPRLGRKITTRGGEAKERGARIGFTRVACTAKRLQSTKLGHPHQPARTGSQDLYDNAAVSKQDLKGFLKICRRPWIRSLRPNAPWALQCHKNRC